MLNLVGNQGEGCEPVCSIRLQDAAEGTRVSIRYAFTRVAGRGILCLLSPCLASMLHTQLKQTVPETWKLEMLERGYKPETVQKRSLAGDFKASRNEELRRRDTQEEARIKAAAMAKARAAGLQPTRKTATGPTHTRTQRPK